MLQMLLMWNHECSDNLNVHITSKQTFTHDPVIRYFIFLAGLCKTVTHQIAFLHTNTPLCPLNQTHTSQSRMISVNFCQIVLPLIPDIHTHTLTQPNTHTQPNPTGQHVRQRSENTFSTWLSNRAALGSTRVLVSAHPSSAPPSASPVNSK